MRFYKIVYDGLILSVGVGLTGEEITETEYNIILETIHCAPTAPDGYGYRLADSLEWELYELPVVEVEDELTETEQKALAYDIVMGVAE